jgi:CheY-like chemotaxis protein
MSRCRLLVVEDSPVALALLQAVLRVNYDVDTATDGQIAIEKALTVVPDLVVTDSLMPKVDGFELIRRLREHPATARVPIVMLTSSEATEEDFGIGLARPNAVVRKSTSLDPLLQQISDLLAARGLAQPS